MEMKQLRAIMQSVKCCTSTVVQGGERSKIAQIFSGLASIFLLEMIKLKNLPKDTLKVHLEGFDLILCSRRVAKVSWRSSIWQAMLVLLTIMSST